MATGSHSAETGSDAYTPHICDPCKYLGSDKPATAHCGKCNIFLCKSCEQAHRGLPATRDHALVTGGLLSSTFKPRPTPQIAYCDDHKSNLINGFCESHNTLTCDVCSSTTHRKCSKSALRKKSGKANESQLTGMIKKMTEMKKNMETLRSSREKNVDVLIEKSEKSIEDIKELRRKINEKMDDLEDKAYKAVAHAKQLKKSGLTDHITACENILKEIDENIKDMKECKASMNVENMFIGIHKSSGKVEKIEKVAADLMSEDVPFYLAFQPSKCIEELLQLKELGHVLTVQSSNVSSKGYLDMTVCSQEVVDIDTDWISGSTFLPSGDLVLCDRYNNKLHLYSPTFTSKEILDLPSGPWDVCTVSDTEVVVTFPDLKKIQFVSVRPRLRLGQSLEVDRRCWGIDCHGDMMYVTCHDNPGNGEVLVVTKDGRVKRRVGLTQGRSMFTRPFYVRVSPTSDRIYVSDIYTHTITCLTQQGDVVYTYKHKDLSGPRDIHVDRQDNILVSGWYSQNIHRVDKHGTHHSILVSRSDGVVGPWCLSYLENDGALVVGMGNKPACKVFWLKK